MIYRPKTRRAGGRRLALPLAVVSALLLVAGTTVLGWAAWQLWGTTAISERRHHDVVEQLHDAWRDPAGGESVDGSGAVTTDFGNATAIVRIPAFGADYAVPVLEGTDSTVLASGFGHRAGTADAGGKGNYVLAGHRVTRGEPLRDMPDLEAGDQVIVETAASTYTYVLDTAGDSLTITDQDTWVADPAPVNPNSAGPSPINASRLITLITCANFTHTPNRLAVFGHLVGVDHRR